MIRHIQSLQVKRCAAALAFLLAAATFQHSAGSKIVLTSKSLLIGNPRTAHQASQSERVIEERSDTPVRRASTLSFNPNYYSYDSDGSKKKGGDRGGRRPYIIGSNRYTDYAEHDDFDMGDHGEGHIISYDRQSNGRYRHNHRHIRSKNYGMGGYGPYGHRGGHMGGMGHLGGNMNRIGINPYQNHGMGYHGMGGPMHGGMGHRSPMGMRRYMMDEHRYSGGMQHHHSPYGGSPMHMNGFGHRGAMNGYSGMGHGHPGAGMGYGSPLGGRPYMGGYNRGHMIKR